MPTLAAASLWRPGPSEDLEGTQTDWPILANGVLCTDAEGLVERPTSSQVFTFVAIPSVEPDSVRVRRAVRRAVQEFGAAFDRLGAG